MNPRWIWLLLAGAVGVVIYGMVYSKKRILISFDWDHDRNYRQLLSALKATAASKVDFEDVTPEEIQSSDVGRIKGVITGKIRSATHILVIVGEHANAYHRLSSQIGERNWQWWEIAQAKAEGKGLIAVKITSAWETPSPLLNSGAKWAHSFNVEAIVKAIDEA